MKQATKLLRWDDVKAILLASVERWSDQSLPEMGQLSLGGVAALCSAIIELHEFACDQKCLVPDVGTLTKAHLDAATAGERTYPRSMAMLNWAVQSGANVAEMLAWDRAQNGGVDFDDQGEDQALTPSKGKYHARRRDDSDGPESSPQGDGRLSPRREGQAGEGPR